MITVDQLGFTSCAGDIIQPDSLIYGCATPGCPITVIGTLKPHLPASNISFVVPPEIITDGAPSSIDINLKTTSIEGCGISDTASKPL